MRYALFVHGPRYTDRAYNFDLGCRKGTGYPAGTPPGDSFQSNASKIGEGSGNGTTAVEEEEEEEEEEDVWD
jgi:hypothetical protein